MRGTVDAPSDPTEQRLLLRIAMIYQTLALFEETVEQQTLRDRGSPTKSIKRICCLKNPPPEGEA
jgi:hypothetical protein